jgi:DNA-binding beta-propeller fold protein YncE
MNRTAANQGGAMSGRIRLSLPALLAIVLATVIGQAPVASASAVRVFQPARSALATTRGSGPFTMVSRDSMPAVSAGSGSFGSALVGSAPVGDGPSVAALDAATHTLYVADGNNANGPNAGGDTVSVIDARHCSAQDVSRCMGPWPTITVGNLPAGVAVDVKTDTVYVTDFGDNTVSVFNGATCNALDTSGCG